MNTFRNNTFHQTKIQQKVICKLYVDGVCVFLEVEAYSPRTLTGAGHHWTVSTSTSCNEWLSLAKTLLKVALAGRNRSLIARTSKCGWAIRQRPRLLSDDVLSESLSDMIIHKPGECVGLNRYNYTRVHKRGIVLSFDLHNINRRNNRSDSMNNRLMIKK